MTDLYPDARSGLSQRLFAWLQSLGNDRYEAQMAERKRELLGGLRGTVLEIGPGTGVNLRYFDPSVDWIGAEPNVFMHDPLREEAARLGRAVTIVPATAERLPATDASVDAVVSTLVLCSVDDQRAAFDEILRVLRPGGRFVFIEHVGAPPGSGLRRLQRFVRPFWKLVGDGCRPDRDTAEALLEAGFFDVSLSAFRMPVPVVSPHIAGVAIKSAKHAPAPETG